VCAARESYAVDDAHRPPLHGFVSVAYFASAARVASGTDRRMDGQTDTAPFSIRLNK